MRDLLVAGVVLLSAANAGAYTKEAARADFSELPFALSNDCLLIAYNLCSNWTWTFSEVPGAMWGVVLDPMDCPGGCASGGAVSEFWFYSLCRAVPGHINGIGVESVDGFGCPTGLLYHSGPMTVTHCVSGDRWTHVLLPEAEYVHVNGNPFAFTIEWGPRVGTRSNPEFATHNGLANIFCSMDSLAQFPGCFGTEPTCSGYTNPPQNTFVYVTDMNGDTNLDDVCAIYGAPYPVSFPFYGGQYMTNNLICKVGLTCGPPASVEEGQRQEASSWGRVKALYD